MKAFAQSILNTSWFEPLVAGLIVLSIGLLLPEVSLPHHHPWLAIIEHIQQALTVVFALELLIRYAAAKRRHRFWQEYWPDILALFPLLRVARFFRLLRLLRLYRLASTASNSNVLQRLLMNRAAEYVLTAFFLFFWIAVGTLGLTHFEEPNAGPKSLVHHFWVSVFTIAQTEYADSLPHSVGGKVVVLCLELCGLTLFAVLTATASAILIDKLRDGTVLQQMQLEDLEDHVIICGWNSGMESTIQQLQHNPKFTQREFVVIADRTELSGLMDVPHRQRVRLIQEDFTRIEVLRRCNVHTASVALIVSDVAHGRSRQDADARTVLAALTIEKLNPDVYTCAELSNAMNESHLRMGKVNEVVITQDLAGHLLAQAAASPSSWRALHELVQPSTPGQGFTTYSLPECDRDREFAVVVADWLAARSVLIVGVYTKDGQTFLNPRKYVLREGDRLVGLPASENGGK